MRDSLLCRCGCNGACTIDSVQIIMNRSMNLLQAQQYMSTRFDGLPWQPTDQARQCLAGRSLELRGAICEYRADLPERSARSGMKGHSATMGCMVCECGNKRYSGLHTCTLHTQPWELRTHESYMEELTAHLVRVDVNSVEEKIRLLSKLHFLAAFPWGRVVKKHDSA